MPSDIYSEISAYHSELENHNPVFSCGFIFWLLVLSCISGTLVGYQQGIIAGSELFLKDEYEGITTQEREFFVSFYALGAFAGTLIGGYMSDRWGRKGSMVIADVFICGGLLWISFIPNMYLGFVGRIITGFGSGISSFAVPMYISEIVPDKYNKKLVAAYGCFSSAGLVGGLNLAIPFRHQWKILFEVGCAPAIVQLIIVIFLPESQNYYINNGEDEKARDG